MTMSVLGRRRARSRRWAAVFALAIGLIVAATTIIVTSREEPAIVWAVGDGDASPNGEAVVKRIAAQEFDHLLYLGDVYEQGTWEEFLVNFDPTYGQLASKTYPTAGNHEWGNRREGYFRYWRQEKGEPLPPWYAFELNGWEILVLNSESWPSDRERQRAWLRAQLTEPGNCRIAVTHHARWSAGTHHGDDEEMDEIWDLLRGRARVFLSAHEHNMQRFRPIEGIVQFVSGAGGKSLYRLARDRRLEFGNDDDYGALKLELTEGELKHAFVSADGEVLDFGRLTCDEG